MIRPLIAQLTRGNLYRCPYVHGFRTPTHYSSRGPLLDEAARLGPMKILETARDAGRKYGITLQLLYQSVGHLERQWGRDGKREWYDGVSHRSYAAVQDLETAKELEESFGTYGVMATSEGSNSGSSGKSFETGSRSRGANTSYH